MKLLVIDGNSIVNRAFYGIKLLTTKNGDYTNAIYGFLNILLRLKEMSQPDPILCEFWDDGIPDSVAIVPGTDGQKMSKSYHNTLPLSGTDKEVKKAVETLMGGLKP